MNGCVCFAGDNFLNSALREWLGHFQHRLVWVVLIVVGLVLGLAGPFGTYSDFPAVVLIIYWCFVAVLTYASGLFAVISIQTLGAHRKWPSPVVKLLGGIAAGVPVTVVVLTINGISYGFDYRGDISALALWGYCTAISLGVSLTFSLIHLEQKKRRITSVESPSVSNAPRILQRLSPAQRGRLFALSVQDHYTQITTHRGKSLVLIRLSDAIAETQGMQGLQIHRSHWVALDAVREGRSKNGRIELELENGDVLRVSRSFASIVREAGLLREKTLRSR